MTDERSPFLTKYVEADLEFNRLLGNMLWAGELKVSPSTYTPPPVPLWKRVRRAIGTFIWAYAPRVHFGPCPDPEGCYC